MLKKQSNSAQSMTIQNLEILNTKSGETMQNISDKSNNNPQQQLTSKNGHISFSVASLLADTRPVRSSPDVLTNTSPTTIINSSSSSATTTTITSSVRNSPITSHHHHNHHRPAALSLTEHHNNNNHHHQSSDDDDYDSNQEDSIVDVEDLNLKEDDNINDNDDSLIIMSRNNMKDQFLSENRDGNSRELTTKESMLNHQGPIRPTPFSALAAAVYQAAHPNWSQQAGFVNPFVGGPGPMFAGPGTPFGVPNMNAGINIILIIINMLSL